MLLRARSWYRRNCRHPHLIQKTLRRIMRHYTIMTPEQSFALTWSRGTSAMVALCYYDKGIPGDKGYVCPQVHDAVAVVFQCHYHIWALYELILYLDHLLSMQHSYFSCQKLYRRGRFWLSLFTVCKCTYLHPKTNLYSKSCRFKHPSKTIKGVHTLQMIWQTRF